MWYLIVSIPDLCNLITFLYSVHTLKRKIIDTNACKLQTSLSERVVDDGHGCHTALAKENKDIFPIKPDLLLTLVLYGDRTSKLLTSCLTDVKIHVIKNCEKAYEIFGKNLFWSIKI